MSCENIKLWTDVCDPNKEFEKAKLPSRQSVLSISDFWGDATGGISAINTSVSLALSKLPGISVTCAVAGFNQQQHKHAAGWGVKLLDLTAKPKHIHHEADKKEKRATKGVHNAAHDHLHVEHHVDVQSMCKEISQKPQKFLDHITSSVKWATHVIGHFPLSHRLAKIAKEKLFPSSKLIIFLHAIPKGLEWVKNHLPYDLPTSEELFELAHSADVFFSVTEPVFNHFSHLFQSQLKDIEPDHRLVLPQPSAELYYPSEHAKEEEEKETKEEDDEETKEEHAPLKKHHVIVMYRSDMEGDWQGLDIALEALSKLCGDYRSSGRVQEMPVITLLDVSRSLSSDQIRSVEEKFESSKFSSDVEVQVNDRDDIRCELERQSLCLITCRSEAMGCAGLQSFCLGVPTLLPPQSYVYSVIESLTPHSKLFAVATTPDIRSAEVDSERWHHRLHELLLEGKLDELKRVACLLRHELREDDVIKQTMDDVITYCAGGMELSIVLDKLVFKPDFCSTNHNEDDLREWKTRDCFNSVLFEIIRHSWRVRRHVLIDHDVLPPKLAHYHLPTHEIIQKVIDDIEGMDRRIVGSNEKRRTLTVYCPTLPSVEDLWARSSLIATTLKTLLLVDDAFLIMCRHRLDLASLKAVMSGPEYLEYTDAVEQLETELYQRKVIREPHSFFSLQPETCDWD